MRWSRLVRRRSDSIGDVPEVRRDLVVHNEVVYLRATNPRIAFRIAELEVQDVGDLRREVFGIGVPVACVGWPRVKSSRPLPLRLME